MDYLDLKKERRHTITLYVGYALVGIAIIFATVILLNQAYGFGVDKKGEVIQNGLVFFSSKPDPADITLNGQLNPKKTNTRLVLPSGVYDVKLSRDGYTDWNRKIELLGGEVKHYDYPFLFPNDLTTNSNQKYTSLPPFITQSPDRKWLVVQPGQSLMELSLIDLSAPTKPAVPVTIPVNLLTKATITESWQLVEWADNNRHILLQHLFDGRSEYILVDREVPIESLNLNLKLSTDPANLSLRDKKFDQYYILDAPGNLQTANLSQSTITPKLKGVISYKSYAKDTIIYATNTGAIPGKTLIKISNGQTSYNLRNVSSGSNYSFDMAKYSGSFYVVFGSSLDSRAYIYKDPFAQMEAEPILLPSTTRVFKINQVNFIGFSKTAQFVVAQGGNRFGVYDFENKDSHLYDTTAPMDVPQVHANWMDGHRLYYVSGGKLFVFDYDNLNQRSLMSATSGQLPAFDPDYKNVFALTSNFAPGQSNLTQTSLLTATDR